MAGSTHSPLANTLAIAMEYADPIPVLARIARVQSVLPDEKEPAAGRRLRFDSAGRVIPPGQPAESNDLPAVTRHLSLTSRHSSPVANTTPMSGEVAQGNHTLAGNSEAVPENSTAPKQATRPETRIAESKLALLIMQWQTMFRPLARIILLVVLLSAAALGYLAMENDDQPGTPNAPSDFSATGDEDSHLSTSHENVPVGHSWALRQRPDSADVAKDSPGAAQPADAGTLYDRSIDTRLADDQRLRSHGREDDRQQPAANPLPAARSWPSEKWPRDSSHSDLWATATSTSSPPSGQSTTLPAAGRPDSVGPAADDGSPRPPAVARLNGTIQPPPNRR